MIFVTLGSQDKKFKRLLDQIKILIEENVINDNVVMQIGTNNFTTTSKKVKIYKFLDSKKYNEYLQKCDLVITHGGVGTILDALKLNKKVIAVPRRCKYKEASNDHQKQIIDKFASEGYIIGCNKLSDLKVCIENAKTYEFKKYYSDNSKMLNIIKNFIGN